MFQITRTHHQFSANRLPNAALIGLDQLEGGVGGDNMLLQSSLLL